MSNCSVLYYTAQLSFGHSEARCRCSFHGMEFVPAAAHNSTVCPLGFLEDRILALMIAHETKIKDLEDRIEQHEQDYYNAQHPQNVRTG